MTRQANPKYAKGITREPVATNSPWIEAKIKTAAGDVPRVATTLRFADRLGSWQARWGIRRMRYQVEPGLYAVGRPTANSPVLLSANYKMSFDHLRSQLARRDAWILALDTKGINVWCAAGKGTFGTGEIVRRSEAAQLGKIVTHRTLVAPQLGAPGVSAHEVQQRSGFRLRYGPVRAEDIPTYLDAGMEATSEMRQVRFPFGDRIALAPMELVGWAKYALLVVAAIFLLAGLGPGIYSLSRVASDGLRYAILFLGAYLAGAVLTPALLPWLPGRAFSHKGAWAGLVFALPLEIYAWVRPGLFEDWLSAVAWLLIIPAVASFLGMNFTGSSTYTSLSGVRREMRIAVPIQVACVVVGIGLWLAGRFV